MESYKVIVSPADCPCADRGGDWVSVGALNVDGMD
jgi:hypothetical protein